MVLSRSSEYALELVFYLTVNNSKKYYPLNVIAKDTGLSFHYLGKIARTLTHKKILISYRGPNGGVKLAQSADCITLFQIIDAIEGDALLNQCILRLGQCCNDNPCAIHNMWLPIRENIRSLFMKTTLGEFTRLQMKINPD